MVQEQPTLFERLENSYNKNNYKMAQEQPTFLFQTLPIEMENQIVQSVLAKRTMDLCITDFITRMNYTHNIARNGAWGGEHRWSYDDDEEDWNEPDGAGSCYAFEIVGTALWRFNDGWKTYYGDD